jgi:hypothetical protein
MIEVIIKHSGEMVASAEAETPEAALLAARTMWDEHMDYAGTYGIRHAMATYFFVDGKLSVMIEKRRP